DGGAEGLLNLVRDLNIVNTLEELGEPALRVKVKDTPLMKRLPKVNPEKQRSKEELVQAIELYNSCAEKIQGFFIRMRDGQEVKLSEIDMVIADMLKASLRDRALLLAIMHQPRNGEYLFTHTMNVFTLCVNLAILLEFDEALLKELAYAAFFNDVGMMLVDDTIRNKTSKLERQEASEIRNHTTYSVRLAARLKGIPKMLPLIIFQTHEKLDGKGYPRGKKGDEIHDLAKVVSVADAYSAMIANRPYRRGGQPYKALEEVIHLAGQKKYEVGVVRSLLKAVNLFPVGSWVRMTDGSYGVIVCPNEAEYARPWVRVVLRHGQKLPRFPLIGPDHPNIRIDRACEPPMGAGSALEAFCER
ncbi:MAG: HD domain-containing protein, partial [Planctomycetes bacterium]|nr:HD domain-containing protein [Planctomycetota bacterium]